MDISHKLMKTKSTTNDDVVPGITKTAIAYAILGVIASSATWIAGYQGDLAKMMLDLVGGITLGIGSAFLYQVVDIPLRPVARVIGWGSVAYGAALAVVSIAPTDPAIMAIKSVTAGALYGAFISGVVLVPLCAIASRILARTSSSV